MLNSIFTTIFTEQQGEIDIQIVAEHPDDTVDFDNAKVYSIWNSDNEPLGLFTRVNNQLIYEGTDLEEIGREQLSDFITSYSEGEWDL